MDTRNNYKHRNHEIIWQHKKLIAKTKNGENGPSLEVVEVASIQCNLVDKQNQ